MAEHDLSDARDGLHVLTARIAACDLMRDYRGGLSA
jgi:hypothetical protein